MNPAPTPSGGLHSADLHAFAPASGAATLLVVEDEPAVRELACEFLRADGYQVLDAADGQEGLNVFREHQNPPIDLVITDVVMPQMDGNVMVEWLRCANPDLKVLFTSGYSEEAIAHRGVLDPGVAFLPKPYSTVELSRRVREMLGATTPAAESLSEPT